MMHAERRLVSHPGILLIILSICLGSFGILMIYDASAVVSSLRNTSTHQYYFLQRQFLWFCLGIAAMVSVTKLNPQLIRRWIFPALGVGIFALILTLIPGIGYEAGGARRWLRIGPLSCQPAEPVILIYVVYAAHLISRRMEKIRDFRFTVLPVLTVAFTIMLLLILQPKVGSALIVGGITSIILFSAGIPLYQVLLLFLGGVSALGIMYLHFGYIAQRIDGWLNPEAHFHGVAFQSIQSLIAIGSGGFTGNGLGNGSQKLFYLPEAHTDFIFAVIAEELGFLGATAVLLVIGTIFTLGLNLAIKQQDSFHRLLCVGVVSMIFIPAVVNIMVSTGLFPVTGIPLPFLSFGGTSLVTNMTAIGLLAAFSIRHGEKIL